jgi:hypothetical protein
MTKKITAAARAMTTAAMTIGIIGFFFLTAAAGPTGMPPGIGAPPGIPAGICWTGGGGPSLGVPQLVQKVESSCNLFPQLVQNIMMFSSFMLLLY